MKLSFLWLTLIVLGASFGATESLRAEVLKSIEIETRRLTPIEIYTSSSDILMAESAQGFGLIEVINRKVFYKPVQSGSDIVTIVTASLQTITLSINSQVQLEASAMSNTKGLSFSNSVYTRSSYRTSKTGEEDVFINDNGLATNYGLNLTSYGNLGVSTELNSGNSRDTEFNLSGLTYFNKGFSASYNGFSYSSLNENRNEDLSLNYSGKLLGTESRLSYSESLSQGEKNRQYDGQVTKMLSNDLSLSLGTSIGDNQENLYRSNINLSTGDINQTLQADISNNNESYSHNIGYQNRRSSREKGNLELLGMNLVNSFSKTNINKELSLDSTTATSRLRWKEDYQLNSSLINNVGIITSTNSLSISNFKNKNLPNTIAMSMGTATTKGETRMNNLGFSTINDNSLFRINTRLIEDAPSQTTIFYNNTTESGIGNFNVGTRAVLSSDTNIEDTASLEVAYLSNNASNTSVRSQIQKDLITLALGTQYKSWGLNVRHSRSKDSNVVSFNANKFFGIKEVPFDVDLWMRNLNEAEITLFNDVNRNNKMDEGEERISDCPVYLSQVGSKRSSLNEKTDTRGMVSFSGIEKRRTTYISPSCKETGFMGLKESIKYDTYPENDELALYKIRKVKIRTNESQSTNNVKITCEEVYQSNCKLDNGACSVDVPEGFQCNYLISPNKKFTSFNPSGKVEDETLINVVEIVEEIESEVTFSPSSLKRPIEISVNGKWLKRTVDDFNYFDSDVNMKGIRAKSLHCTEIKNFRGQANKRFICKKK